MVLIDDMHRCLTTHRMLPMLFIKIPMATAHMHKDVDVILMGIPADRLFKRQTL